MLMPFMVYCQKSAGVALFVIVTGVDWQVGAAGATVKPVLGVPTFIGMVYDASVQPFLFVMANCA